MTVTAAVLDGLAREGAGRALLDAAADREDVHLVGGAVRDHLIGRAPRELDVVVEGDALELAESLARALDGGVAAHPRFGTATIVSAAGRVDLAAARRETYAAPGALPEVTLGASLEEDLARRDFTVNAMAVCLGGASRGRLTAVPDAEEDLAAARLRVLHPASFIDDPTRLIRLGRYVSRLAFAAEPHTRAWAAEAVAGGALDAISGARAGAELRAALGEGALGALAELGVLERLGLHAHPDLELAGRAAGVPGLAAQRDLIALAVACEGLGDAEASALLDRLALGSRDRGAVLDALHAVELAAVLAAASRASQVRRALDGRSGPALALASAHGAAEQVRGYLEVLRHTELQITGDDLIAAGVAGGPEVGRRLARTLDAVLDGEVGEGREEQLRAALETAG